MDLSRVRPAAPTALVAAVFLLTVELLRGTAPLLDLTKADLGVVGAAGVAALIFAAPAVAGVAVALAGPARAALGAVGLLLLLRLVAQVQDPATLPVVGAGAATGIAALVLVLRQAPTGIAGGVGVLVGGVADLAVRAAYGSWDALFRPGAGPWLVVLAVVAVAVAALVLGWSSARHHGAGGSGGSGGSGADTVAVPAGRVAALGPYLGLYLLLYGSAPVVAAHGDVPAPAAAAVLIAAAVVSIEVVRRMRLPGGAGQLPEPDRWFAGTAAGLAAVGAVAVGYWTTGAAVPVAAAVAAIAAAVLLVRALTSAAASTAPRWRASGYAAGAAAAGWGYLLPVMIYQVDFELELPFDSRYALVVAAVLLAAAGSGGRPREHPVDRPDGRGTVARLVPGPVAAVAALALLVPLAMAVTRPAIPEPASPQVTGSGAEVRLLSWNVMYGRDHAEGVPDPEAVAQAIEAADPDVVLLQEVSRGWPIGGGVDLLEYLSRRLAMPYRWSPAADGQFGNALLTRLPLSDVATARLPFVQGPMERSYVAATVQLSGGQELHLVNAHLQHRKDNTPTRLVQSRALLDIWDRRPHTVVAGDFNFWPSWRERDVWDGAGLVSAQDVTGHGGEFTVPSDDPDNQVDWIFGTPDLTFSDFAIRSAVTQSDHYPLVVTVTVD